MAVRNGVISASIPLLTRNVGNATITAGPLNGTIQQAVVAVTPAELVLLAITPLALAPGTVTLTARRPEGFAATTTLTVVLAPPLLTGFGPPAGAIGTVVTLTGVNLGHTTRVTFNGTLASFTIQSDTQLLATVPAGSTTGPIVVTTPSGSASTAAAFAVLVPPTLTITSPADGATINADSVMVRGTVSGGATEVGVVVNGVPMLVMGNQWAATVPLGPGSNAITVTATTPQGASTVVQVTVQAAQAQEPVVILNASPASGLTPLTVTFTVTSGLDQPIVSYAFDQDGDGIPDRMGTTFENVQVTYTSPGLMMPTLRVTDDQGRTITATALAQVLDRAGTVAMLETKWEGLKAALAARDISRALGEVAASIRARFLAVFQALDADLPTIAPTLGTVAITRVSEGLAEGVVPRVQDGKTYLYYIYWAPDADGIWRIIEM